VKDKGRAWSGRFMVLSVLTDADHALNANDSGSRIGFITSRRVGGAVIRNRVRRRLREAVRQSRPRLRAGCWIVLIARNPAARASLTELNEEWLRLARRASILQAPPAPSP
jgi:ribonuclease P protein component